MARLHFVVIRMHSSTHTKQFAQSVSIRSFLELLLLHAHSQSDSTRSSSMLMPQSPVLISCVIPLQYKEARALTNITPLHTVHLRCLTSTVPRCCVSCCTQRTSLTRASRGPPTSSGLGGLQRSSSDRETGRGSWPYLSPQCVTETPLPS